MCVCTKPLQLCLFVTPWTVARQAPLSKQFSRHEYWSGLPCSSPGDLPDPGVILASPKSPELASRFFTTMPPGKPQINYTPIKINNGTCSQWDCRQLLGTISCCCLMIIKLELRALW